MIKDNVYLGDIQHEFYGNTDGSCAWCSKPNANQWYIGEISNGMDIEYALYHVCNKCYKDGVGQ